MEKICIIEDDPVIRDELSLILHNEGYWPLAITEFTQVGEQVRQVCADLILLDLGLPNQSGFSLCAEIRALSQTPIIFVTSRDSAMDELQALSLGADDYITKPYNIPVLLARIKAALRRSLPSVDPDALEFGGLTLHLSKATAQYGANAAELTRNELKILAHLMRHPGQIVSRADLIDALWDSQIYIDDNTLSVNMARLRVKLEALGLPGYIKTRRAMGYQL